MNKLKRGVYFLREEGFRRTLGRGFSFLSNRLLHIQPSVQALMVETKEVLAVDWTELPARFEIDPVEGPIELAWVMSPPGKASGGHQNLFRFIRFAEDAGYVCRIYLYSTAEGGPSLEDTKRMLSEADAYADVAASIERYDSAQGVAPTSHGIFATGWETAYPVYLDPVAAKRFYFVQDFEPSFYPVGSQSILAENTYRFGFHGITAGGWLSQKLSSEYRMPCAHFDFASDPEHYSVTNTGVRNEVFFYARPVTARRAFELGVLVLEEFARLRPDVKINLAGWDVSEYDLSFKYESHGAMDLSKLNELYNRCRAGLVLSLTNMSLLPLELLSSGVVPVVNDGPNNTLVSSHPGIEYVAPNPHAMARKLAEVFDRDVDAQALAGSGPVRTWEDSGAQFVQAVEQVLRGE